MAVGDSNPSEELARAVEAHGFADLHADWRDLLARDDLDVVSVCGPNLLHRDMGVAVAESGQHLWIEKPAGRNAEETAEIVAAVEAAGVQSAAGFNYRNAPAVEHARELVARRRARQPADRRVRFLADYSAHPEGALSWRFLNEQAGSGVSATWSAMPPTWRATSSARWTSSWRTTASSSPRVRSPRVPDRTSPAASRGPSGDVENEDYVAALLRFASGARGTLGRRSHGRR